MNKSINIEQIHKYINNELSVEELEQFEKKLDQDADLLEEVNTTIILKAKYRTEQKQLWQDYEADYAANPEKWHEEFGEPETSSPILGIISRFKYPIAIAASLLLFLIAYFLIPSSSNPQTLAAQYWKEATAPNQLISSPEVLKGGQGKTITEDEAKNHLKNAYDSYKVKEYKSVSNALQLIPPESQHYSEALILSGVAYFELKENKKAINQFKKILKNRSLSGNDDARKFLSLIYLQTNQTEEAKKILKKIIEAEDSFEEEAKKLLKRLE